MQKAQIEYIVNQPTKSFDITTYFFVVMLYWHVANLFSFFFFFRARTALLGLIVMQLDNKTIRPLDIRTGLHLDSMAVRK